MQAPLLILAAFFPVLATALTCFENDDMGRIVERTNSSWTYCSLVPFGSHKQTGRLHGVGPNEEATENFDNNFAQNNALYKVLTVCIYEKYDLGKLNPRFGVKPEFLFRCFCNFDRCNSATTFSPFLSNLRQTSD